MKKRWWCNKCGAELTEADQEAGECTQCHAPLPLTTKPLDLRAPVIEADFRISYQRGKQIQNALRDYCTLLNNSAPDPFLYPPEMRNAYQQESQRDIDLLTELAKEFD